MGSEGKGMAEPLADPCVVVERNIRHPLKKIQYGSPQHHNEIPVYPIFYLIKGDHGLVFCFTAYCKGQPQYTHLLQRATQVLLTSTYPVPNPQIGTPNPPHHPTISLRSVGFPHLKKA